MIVSYRLVDTLIEDERPDVLGAMVGCAQDVAIELQLKLKVGTGCLEWQLEDQECSKNRTQISTLPAACFRLCRRLPLLDALLYFTK